MNDLKNLKDSSEQAVRYGFVEKLGEKYLILTVWESGVPIWSRHFKIAEVDSNEGIRNDHYDKRVDEFFKSSSGEFELSASRKELTVPKQFRGMRADSFMGDDGEKYLVLSQIGEHGTEWQERYSVKHMLDDNYNVTEQTLEAEKKKFKRPIKV